MARRGRRNRDTSDIASTLLVSPPRSLAFTSAELARLYARASAPLEVEDDLRRWDPEGVDRPARTGVGQKARIREFYHATRFVGQPGFARPRVVMECVRRAVRREVLHALRRTRSGAGGKKRRNWRSLVRC